VPLRYFGVSYPVKKFTKKDIRDQLTPRQALQDTIHFIQAKQAEYGCGPRGSKTYCPVMTVGGSYAGLLSTLIRKTYPDVVDIGYSGSPCLLLFGHQVTPYRYYEYITQVAETISHGCKDAVRSAIAEVQADLGSTTKRHQLQSKAKDYGICPNLPHSIKSGDDLAEEISSYTSSNFAGTNMDYYPPSPDQPFFKGCTIFQDNQKTVPEKVKAYIAMISGSSQCYDLSAGDADAGEDGVDLWDALCCYLVPQIGKSKATMWPPHKYKLQNDVKDCRENFGIELDREYLEKEFGVNDLSDVTHLLITNGVNDGWYALSYTDSVPSNHNGGVVLLTMENGAHHSDLTHQLQADTPDVELVHAQIADLIATWLAEIK